MSNEQRYWLNPKLQRMNAYAPPKIAEGIRLDAMENPFEWPSSLQEKWLKRMANIAVNRYPDPNASGLRHILSQVMEIPEGYGMLFGNGSDELIQILAMSVATEGKILLTVEPGFTMYRHIAIGCGLKYEGIPLTGNDFSLDPEAVINTISNKPVAILFLALPNNPTGNIFSPDAMKKILEHSDVPVVIDEAYFAFHGDGNFDWVRDYSGVIIMRSFSKIGLAGLRLGVLFAPHNLLAELEKLRLPYNINTLTQESAQFALEHYDVLQEQVMLINQLRGELYTALQKLPNLHVWPSQANFLLFRVPQAEQVFNFLVNHSVLIRNFHGSHPLLEDCLRVSVGSREENTRFIELLSHVVT